MPRQEPVPFHDPKPIEPTPGASAGASERAANTGGGDGNPGAGWSSSGGGRAGRGWRPWRRPAAGVEKPLRDELLSIEGLEERALGLAGQFPVRSDSKRRPNSVLPRFAENVRTLRAAYLALSQDVRTGRFTTGAAECLLDNFHVVSAAMQDIRQNLPPTYYRGLPMVEAGGVSKDARVFALAIEIIRYSDSRLDAQQLTQFLDSYQRVAPLTIGELWAWPSMLKLALIENLRRLADQSMAARAERRGADATIAAFEDHADPRLARLPPLPGAAYLVQLLQRLREYGLRLLPLRTAIEEHLRARQATPEEAIRAEHQRQGIAQASVANAIASLRLCATFDWQTYVESVSLVERALQRDPAGAYGRMDFPSRDRQRKAVEELAAPDGAAQVAVAQRAVERARAAAARTSAADRKAHAGYYLLDRG